MTHESPPVPSRSGWRSALDVRTLITELVVVFIGLFAALQVDQWAEDRALAETETVYLHRLNDDLTAYLAASEQTIERQRRWREGVAHVQASLEAGHVLDGDTAAFERGLIRVGHLPSTTLHRATYDEMVATGVFARLGSRELKRTVSELYAAQETVERNFRWWRDGPEKLMQAYYPMVGFHRDESGRRARFDFDALRADPYVRAGYYWAVDTHDDWIRELSALRTAGREAQALVMEELEGRH